MNSITNVKIGCSASRDRVIRDQGRTFGRKAGPEPGPCGERFRENEPPPYWLDCAEDDKKMLEAGNAKFFAGFAVRERAARGGRKWMNDIGCVRACASIL
jgi:hypothetical protein